MDTSAVIQLSCQAAESVLRFRAVGFTRRPVIDLQSIRAAITAQIEKVTKDHRHRFEVPLAEVVNYAGVGAARAAEQWNMISHKENHVATEWFRNCVCNLVSGVVSDIGQLAFEDQGMNACMYLEPDDYDPFDVASYTRAAPVSEPSLHVPSHRDDYYGFEEAETQQADDHSPVDSEDSAASNATLTASETLPLRHEITNGFTALNKLATSQKDSSALADFIESTKSLQNASEPAEAGPSQETLLESPTKRPRLDSSDVRLRPSLQPAGPGGSSGSVTENVPKAQRCFWTHDEVNILVTARDFGRTWDEVVNILPRHTAMACRSKYRAVKHKDSQSNTTYFERLTAFAMKRKRGDVEEEEVDMTVGDSTSGTSEAKTDAKGPAKKGSGDGSASAGSSVAP